MPIICEQNENKDIWNAIAKTLSFFFFRDVKALREILATVSS